MKEYRKIAYTLVLSVIVMSVLMASCSKEVDKIPIKSMNEQLKNKPEIRTPKDLIKYIYFTVLRPNFNTDNIKIYEKKHENSNTFTIHLVRPNIMGVCSSNNSDLRGEILEIKAQRLNTHWEVLEAKKYAPPCNVPPNFNNSDPYFFLRNSDPYSPRPNRNGPNTLFSLSL